MPKKSAGILLYRKKGKSFEVFLVHPGGPYWAKKDAGAWSIPKGEFDDNEDALTAAKREFEEETGTKISGVFIELTPVKLKSNKTVFAWAVEGDLDPLNINSNEFEIEWPPRSGKMRSFPEIDKAAWFNLADAEIKINSQQIKMLEEMKSRL